MWYRSIVTSDCAPVRMPTGNPGPVPLEEKIICADAEIAIRRRMFLSGNYSPTTEQVKHLVARVLKQIKERYSDISTIRRDVVGEQLFPVVEAEVARLKI